MSEFQLKDGYQIKSESKNSLINLMKTVDSIVSVDWKDCYEEDALHYLKTLQNLMTKACVNTSDVENLLSECDCSRKKLFCLISTIALICASYLKQLKCYPKVSSNTCFELFFSLEDKQHLAHIFDFIFSYGLVRNMEYQISILVPIQEISKCCKKIILLCCKYILACVENERLYAFVLPKHLLPLLGTLMQLVYSPNSIEILAVQDVSFCKKSLLKLISTWSQTKDLVKCLFILQGSSTRKTPVWLRKACGFLLSKCLLRQFGVAVVLSACLSTLGSKMDSWKKAEIASQILSTPPKTSSIEDYFSNVCSQILNLFNSHFIENQQNDQDKVFLQALSATVLALHKKSFVLLNQYFFVQLLRPLNQFYITSVDDASLDVTQEGLRFQISTCIEILHAIFVLFNHSHKEAAIKSYVFPHLKSLFALFVWTRDTLSHLQTFLRQILAKSLQVLDSDKAAKVLLCICGILTENDSEFSMLSLKDALQISFGENSVICLTHLDVSTRKPEDVIDNQNKKVQAVVDLMSSSGVQKLPSSVFILLLQKIETISNEKKVHGDVNKLLSNDEKATLHLHEGESQLLSYALLTSLCEDGDPQKLFDDTPKVVSFVSVILQRSADNSSNDDEHFQINNESLRLCFAVIGLCLVNTPSRDQQKAMEILILLLQKLSRSKHLSKEDCEMASDLSIAIATHGSYTDGVFDSFSQSMKEQVTELEKQRKKEKQTSLNVEQPQPDNSDIISSKKKPCPDIENNIEDKKVSQSAATLNLRSVRNNSVQSNSKKNNFSSYNEALSSIYDPCPSIRAAGLRFITIAAKNNEVKENFLKLLQIFLEILMKEEDSFVYLSAIQGLVEIINRSPMVGVQTSSLFDKLLNEYKRNLLSKHDEAEVKVIKLGEVLMRLIGKLGDLSDHQSDKFLPILFLGSRDRRPAVRSSCISNLSELCPFIKYKLNAFKHELSECICATAIFDENVDVRRAAVLVLRKLVESLQADFLKIFSDSAQRFYSMLKQSYEKDPDHVVQLHAQLALEALDLLMRDVLFAKSTNLEKKIVVLP